MMRLETWDYLEKTEIDLRDSNKKDYQILPKRMMKIKEFLHWQEF